MTRHRALWLIPALSVVLASSACSKDDKANEGGGSADDKGDDSSGDKKQPEDKGKKAPAISGPFSDLAEAVNGAATAVFNGATGKGIDEKLISPTVKATVEAAAQQVKELGDAKVLLTAVELEGIRQGGSPSYVRTMAAVFPDGKIRWVMMTTKGGEVLVSPTAGVEEAAPALHKGVMAMIAQMAGDHCSELPMVGPADAEGMPASVASKMKDASSMRDKVCAEMKGQKDGWQVRVDDVTVIIAAGDKAGMLRTGFEVKDGKLVLNNVRYRPQ